MIASVLQFLQPRGRRQWYKGCQWLALAVTVTDKHPHEHIPCLVSGTGGVLRGDQYLNFHLGPVERRVTFWPHLKQKRRKMALTMWEPSVCRTHTPLSGDFPQTDIICKTQVTMC